MTYDEEKIIMEILKQIDAELDEIIKKEEELFNKKEEKDKK